MLKKYFFSATILLLSAFASLAQKADSLFTSVVDGKNVLTVRFTSQMPLAKISNDYNVSEELLRLFNDKLPAKVEAGDEIIVPLVESNYYKNTSLQLKNGMYLPLYHIVNEGETLLSIARSYLLPETSIMRWNDLTVAQVKQDDVLLIGWLRFGNQQTAFNKAEDSRLQQIKSDVGRTVQNAKEKIGTTASNVGDKIKENTKPVEVEKPAIIDSTKNALKDIRKDIRSGVAVVNEKFRKLQDDITTRSNKLTKNVSTSYSKEKEKLDKEREERTKKKEAEKQAKLAASPVVKEWVDTKKEADKVQQEKIVPPEVKAPPAVEVKEVAKQEVAVEEVKTNETNSLYDLAGTQSTEAAKESEEKIEEAKLLADLEKAAEEKQKEKVPAKPAVANPKTKSIKKVTAAWFYTGELGSEYFAITNLVAEGKLILITNPNTGKQVQATVMGKLSEDELASGLNLLLSSTAQTALGTTAPKVNLQVAEIVR
jgi:LysM repeat protein